jgi:hypothetical protein
MRALLDRLINPLHLLIALAALWLLASSPWLSMYRKLPAPPGAINLSHVLLGTALLLLGVVYALACTVGGRWRLYFPWLAGQGGAVWRDLAGMFRGQRPMSEGGGLFGAIEGLLLLALLAAATTGVLWWLQGGSADAFAWRDHHVVAARTFAVLLAAHLVAVSLHLLDLVRG